MAAPPPLIPFPPVPHQPPDIHDAATNMLVQVQDDAGIIEEEGAYLLEDSPNVLTAYQRWPGHRETLGDGRGHIFVANLLFRVQRDDGRTVFRRTDISVAIKRLNRQVIDLPLLQGTGNENPYNEISVMQHHGDNVHIYECYEALWDKNFLYIVTLYAQEGDLFTKINWGLGGGYNRPAEIRPVAKRLAENLKYLVDRDLVHRDLKPENILTRTPDFPLIDLAMTLQIPRVEGNRQLIIASQGAPGSFSYTSPEVEGRRAFDHKADVWAYGSILFNLLTGFRLFHMSSPVTVLYDFFITQGGLGDEDLCDRRLEELYRDGGEESPLAQRIQAVQVVDTVARELLTLILQHNPRDRPDVDTILNHRYFQGWP